MIQLLVELGNAKKVLEVDKPELTESVPISPEPFQLLNNAPQIHSSAMFNQTSKPDPTVLSSLLSHGKLTSHQVTHAQ
jgi:hypothetical protein